MKKLILILTVVFLSAPALWAEEPQPPVPVPAGDDFMPPPLDLNSLTPLPVPADSGAPSKSPKPASEEMKPAPENTPVPPPAPTPTAVPAAKKEKAAPPAPPAAPAESTSNNSAAASTGGVLDYFPEQAGYKLTYEYLKPAAGSKSKKIRTLECLGSETMANGTVRVSFKTTDDGKVYYDKYSIYDNKVEHTSVGKMVLQGHVVLELPPAGGDASWQMKGGDGMMYSYKATFGSAEVFKKTYPDCIIVVEKPVKGGATKYYYYAKGLGLISIEVYGKGMKLALAESFALVSQ